MPTVEILRSDLLKLAGVEESQLEELLFLLGIEVEEEGEEMKIEVTANRPDMFSSEGIARAMKGYLGKEKGLARYSVRDGNVTVINKGSKDRPFVAAAVLRGLSMTEAGLVKSLMQLQEKLHDGIGRDRRKVAIGVHDLSKVTPPFTYGDANPETAFVPLGFTQKMSMKEILQKHPKGQKYAHLVKTYPLFTDSRGAVLSFPPVINGELTKITDSTTDLFLDVTGNDERAVTLALNILVCNIAERGVDVERVTIVGGAERRYPELSPRQMKVPHDEIQKLIGVTLGKEELKAVLERMRYESLGDTVLVPPYRVDIMHPVDIIEDVAIGYGYNNITPELPNLTTIGGLTQKTREINRYRELMIGLGFQEFYTFIISNKEELFTKMDMQEGQAIEILNPVSSSYSCMRTSLLPTVMSIVANNKHNLFPQKVFEAGPVVLPGQSDTGTIAHQKCAGAVTHEKANFAEIKGVIDNLLRNLGIKYEVVVHAHPSFVEGRCAEITSNGKRIGIFGEIQPQVLTNWEIENPVAAFEVEIL